MIGKPVTGASFYDCLRYCLEDKRDLSEDLKLKKTLLENVQHKNRAEVLDYNNCFGDLKKLTKQFIDVAQLNRKVEKPVFHFTLRPAPEDIITKEQFTEIGHKCAKEFGLENNQYVIILHKDTKQPHIHIVANRVDPDGKVVKDTFSAKRMQSFCRKIEEEYQLKQVLSSRTFLPEELRHIPRHDSRKEKLKKDIQQTLERVNTYQQFEEKMKSLGYAVLKARGICFIDEKKVRIKGSEVGFPLAKIEKVLGLKHTIRQKEELLKAKEKLRSVSEAKQSNKEKEQQQSTLSPAARLLQQFREKDREQVITVAQEEIQIMQKIVHSVIYELLKPEHADMSVAPELLREAKRKRKRLRPKL